MEEKKIDNEININNEKKDLIKKIDDDIDNEKRKLKELDDMQEELISLNRNMDKCIELLQESMKGPTTESEFGEMQDETKLFFYNTSSIIDNENTKTRKNLNKLYDQKDELINKDEKPTE